MATTPERAVMMAPLTVSFSLINLGKISSNFFKSMPSLLEGFFAVTISPPLDVDPPSRSCSKRTFL
ncbi:MAG: hypothetical protein Q6353_017475 [Candidatus Sigynarchaeum springense]